MEIALTLTLMSSSLERLALSKLKLIKYRLRTMRQERLQSLMLMSVEPDILQELDLDNLVQTFADIAP